MISLRYTISKRLRPLVRLSSTTTKSDQLVHKTHLQFPGAAKSPFTNRLSEQPTIDPIATFRVLSPNGEPLDPKWKPKLPVPAILSRYRDMVFISEMDVAMLEVQRQGRVSFYMVCAGEEAIGVGVGGVLDKKDVVFCQYREQGVYKARGLGTSEFMEQLVAGRGDSGRGRNMPVHYGSRELNMHTISSPLATQIPQAAGAAYALKLQKMADPQAPGRVVAVIFGDGAASEGDFHAGLNIAATKGCPVLFICRNNGWAISTVTKEQYRGDGIASRGAGYGILTVRVDGNDFWAVTEAVSWARERALEEGGRPVLLEMMTYRVAHHSTSDDSLAYRGKDEVESWRRGDNPLFRMRRWLEREGLWSEEQESETRREVRRTILEEFKKAENGGKPGLRSMFEDVYETLTPELEAQMKDLKGIMERYPDEYDVTDFDGGLADLDETKR